MSNQTDMPSPKSLRTLIVAIVGTIGWVIVSAVAVSATSLRPALDDYCRASRGLGGYPNAVELGYATWSGDLFQMGLVELLVGQPLVHLPLQVASAIPFLLTAVSVASLTSFLILRAVRASKRRIVLVIFAGFSLILVLWWAYWWVPTIAEQDPYSTTAHLASATTHWQNVNIAYVLVPMVLISAWAVVRTRERWPRWARMSGMLLVGFLSGVGGLVFAVAAIAFVILLWLASSWLAKRLIRTRILETSVFVIAALMGIVVASLSLGAQSRGDMLAETRPLQYVSPQSVFAWVFPEGVFDWFSAIFHPGALLVLLASTGFAVLLVLLRVDISPSKLLSAASGLLAFSFILSVAARAGAAFAYVAYWHQVMPRSIVFVALVLAGTAAGAWLLARSSRLINLLLVAAVLVAGAVSVGSIFEMRSAIESRSIAWQSGPAPLPGLPDIEVDWVGACWNDWSAVVELPSRDN